MKIQKHPLSSRIKTMIWLLGISLVMPAYAESVTNSDPDPAGQPSMLLTDVLSASLAVSRSSSKIDNTPDYQSASWLAASPSARLNYLKSQQDFGSDEVELSLNLAIKSNLQRDIDSQLIQIDQQLSVEQLKIRQLYFSGLIREAVWSYKIASTNKSYLQKKLSVLKQLENNHQQLVDAGETSEFGLLLIQKELIRTQVELLENQRELQLWQTQYQAISGMSEMPNNIDETKFDNNNRSIAQHPEIQLLEKRWQQTQLMSQASSSDASPWNIAVSAVNTDTQGEQDKQIGVSFEVPLTFIEANSQALKNQNSQAKKQFDIDYQTAFFNINQQLDQRMENSRFLTNKRGLLKRSIELNQQIMRQLDRLKNHNEMGQEFILRRVIDAMKTQNEFALTKLLIQQNNAMSRQTAGLTL